MKKILSILTVSLFLTYSFSWVFAATTSGTPTKATPWATSASSKVDHFEVTTNPVSTKIGEAIDLTIKAVDSSWNVKKDYAWTIYITVENDTKATVPYVDWYQFTAADLWQKTFSKWLSFTKEGKMKVVVMDIDNDQLEWTIEVAVGNGAVTDVSAASWEITITSPDNGMTISENKVTVSWSSKKNSKVKFFLNGVELKDLEWQTDEKGSFSAEIKNLTQSTNVIQVKILDGNDKIIAASSNITVNIENSGPVFKGLTIKEWQQAPAWSEINITMTADASLSESNVMIWDVTQPLKESESTPGTYEWKITLPAIAWDYSLDVSLKNSLWKVTTKKWVATIKAIESNIFKNIKAVTGDKKVTFDFEVSPDKPEYTKFKFIYWTDAETLKTAWDTQNKESITFDKAKIKSKTGSTYSWYIPGLDPALGKYYFQIQPVGADGKVIEWIQSDIVDVDFSLNAASSAGKCTISNVSWLKAMKNWDVSELSWDSLPEATSYNVYKKWEDGQFTLIENVKINKYTLNIASDKVKYDEFAIKATCGDWESKIESWDYSNVTKVQTWPGQFAVLIWLSLIIWFFFVRKRFAK